MNDMLVIGIAGGTASGKTTLTRSLAERFSGELTIIEHDSYYRAYHELTFEERTKLNYDHPDIYETELLVEHLGALRQGRSVEVPVYDYPTYDRSDKTTTVEPTPVVIVEGIMILADEALRDQMDIKVFVDADADVRILRRVLRDATERGRSLQSVINQYLATVKPMHEQFVEPSKRYADIVVPSGTESDQSVALDMLEALIRAHLSS
jgi:uridine kinase